MVNFVQTIEQPMNPCTWSYKPLPALAALFHLLNPPNTVQVGAQEVCRSPWTSEWLKRTFEVEVVDTFWPDVGILDVRCSFRTLVLAARTFNALGRLSFNLGPVLINPIKAHSPS